MRSRVAARDWAATRLGPMDGWPTSLRSLVGTILGSRFPMLIWWGPDLVHIYNDGYAPILGDKHPAALGQPAAQVWAEIWDVVGPMAEGVLAGAAATWSEDLLLLMNRHGIVEEAYFTFSYSPALSDDGAIGGVLVTVQETTARVYGERQLRLLGQLAERCGQARSCTAVCETAASVFEGFAADIPFSMLYLGDPSAGKPLSLAASSGLPEQSLVGLDDLQRFFKADDFGNDGIELSGATMLAGVAIGPWADPATQVTVLPLRPPARPNPYGFLVVGHSAKRLADAGYKALFRAVADRLAAALASATAFQEEEARHATLAEIDRAKTAFFTNISHEFRTPLTLMLGPIEEALKSRALEGDDLELVYRNGRRLLRLVNGLLDFARIEAGRLKTEFVPTDLVKLTRDLVSAFRSAAERSELTLRVETDLLGAPVNVDVEMFEKIVSNLLSNAIKFTRKGTISVALRDRGETVELEVADTGIGISEAELPRLFERFHRVENTWSRTQEGSGIGLALLKDLAALHGGSVAARSQPDVGTTISVSLPKGLAKGHAEQATDGLASRRLSTHSIALADEAMAWSGDDQDGRRLTQSGFSQFDMLAQSAERLLVADDNADMRDYLSRILGARWQVQAVSNGEEALQAIAAAPPDLILSDVMMPRVDGFALLATLRGQPTTRSIPFMLISARAGEEARIEAVQAGADDYVVKPFSARELVARVEAQLLRLKLSNSELEQGRRLAEVFEKSPVGVALLRGPEHRYEFVNSDYANLVSRRPLVGLTIREALPELAGQGIYELLDGVYRTSEPYIGRSFRVLVADFNGEPQERFFDFVYRPTLGVDGKPNGVAIVAYDVSALTAARREADAANRAKDEFLAMLGHELRNPLAPIVTALHVMRMSGDHMLKRERGIVERQVDHLVRLVDDLLDVSRIASGKIELKKARIDMREVVGAALEMASPALEQHRHRLEYEVGGVPLWVEGDPARLGQVVSNLLVNAAKYTPSGGEIRLSLRQIDERVELLVVDNGIGIAPETLATVFDLFTQERQAIDRAKGGLGLGLALVKSFVDLHGGQVSAKSDGHGKGSEFKVVLPAAERTPDTESKASPSAPPRALRRRVLIVDDNVDAALALALALELHGVETITAADGPQALVAASSFKPEIAVLDIGLPVMDGYELGAALREQQSEIRLIALTGYGGEVDRRRSSEGAFEMHLVKPVDIAELLHHLQGDVRVKRP